MGNLGDELLTAFEKGNLLQVINEKERENWGNLDTLLDELVKLHNDGKIDIIDSFKTLKNESNPSINFFPTRHILEKTLSRLESPISAVMECVLNLTKEAGQDMAAGMLIPPFIDFCSTNVSRPKEALTLVEKFVGQYDDLLTPIIVAGARLDIEFYLGKAIRLTKHDDIEIRRRAIFSLGRIDYSERHDLPDRALSCLELSVIQETDDHLLAGLIKSTFSLCKHSQSQVERIVDVINKALSKGDDYALHAGTELFGFNLDELPNALLDCLLLHLLRVKPGNKGSLDNIDFGLAKLLAREDREKGMNFLEALLLAHPKDSTLDIFDSIMRELLQNNENILNRLMTRWFIKGKMILCKGIKAIVDVAHEQNIRLAIEPSELDCSDPVNIIFVARKSIGYLFSTPVTAASIIISLLHQTTDDETTQILINLLFYPLLISYPGMVKDYLAQKADIETEKLKKALETAINLFDDYLANIKSAGNIRELHPSQSQRDTHHRLFSQIMSQGMKEARKDSVFLSFVSTSVLLYGRKSIDYVYNSDGQSNRMEIPLQSHSVEMEFPRLANIDPLGLDYMLHVFRTEYIKL